MYNEEKEVGMILRNGKEVDSIIRMGQCLFSAGSDADVSGELPLTLTNSKGKNLSSWSITGNTIQNGTPGEVLGVGDYDAETGKYKIPIASRGKNLATGNFKGYIEVNDNMIVIDNDCESFIFFAKKNKQYTMSCATALNRSTLCQLPSLNVEHGVSVTNIRSGVETTFTSEFTGYCAVYVNSSKNEAIKETFQIEEGSTATEYTPYVEPIETVLYLDTPLMDGEVMFNDGVREVKWGVVDLGDINYNYLPSADAFYSDELPTLNANPGPNDLCTAYTLVYPFDDWENMPDKTFEMGEKQIIVRTADYTNVADFKNAMKGVLVYYELKTPTTKSFDAPDIPTINGECYIDVVTAVAPTDMTVTYKSKS